MSPKRKPPLPSFLQAAAELKVDCSGCQRAIDGPSVWAMDAKWHPHCLLCRGCGLPFQHTETFYTRDGEPHHQACVGALPGCGVCGAAVYGPSAKAAGKFIHLDCATCKYCHHGLSHINTTLVMDLHTQVFHSSCHKQHHRSLASLLALHIPLHTALQALYCCHQSYTLALFRLLVCRYGGESLSVGQLVRLCKDMKIPTTPAEYFTTPQDRLTTPFFYQLLQQCAPQLYPHAADSFAELVHHFEVQLIEDDHQWPQCAEMSPLEPLESTPLYPTTDPQSLPSTKQSAPHNRAVAPFALQHAAFMDALALRLNTLRRATHLWPTDPGAAVAHLLQHPEEVICVDFLRALLHCSDLTLDQLTHLPPLLQSALSSATHREATVQMGEELWRRCGWRLTEALGRSCLDPTLRARCHTTQALLVQLEHHSLTHSSKSHF
eukprot:NODE_1688_length_1412_cov_48.248249_g1602_i0.p1 GENE.NODE_1688_length_1412_cov_48.248249_g1602_i0~~NODE_1688_length_1412_cov_48.248249_g1602_i0.p1  ORF type:complete len:435 (+),score=66.60 NODE_1688_length_1412_cov_48.248249_g1602_i0:58-1362(+)